MSDLVESLLRWSGFAAVLLVVAACGPPTTAEPVTLRVVMADDWADAPAVLDAVRDFERAHEDVEVDLQGLPFSQIPDAVRAAAGTDRPFDVAHWHAFAAGAQGLARPVDDLWDEHLDHASFTSGAIEDVTWDGRRYGVPLDVNAMVLLANRDLLERHGVSDLPQTFEEVREVARAVTSPDGEVRGMAVAHSGWTTYGWIRAAGGEIVEADAGGQARVAFDDPGAVTALQFLTDLVREGVAFPPVSRNVPGDAFAIFRSGKAALHVSGTWDVAALENAEAAWELDVALLPTAAGARDAGSVLGGSSLFVPETAASPELGFTFMRHLVADDYALRYATEEGRLPARHRVYEDDFFDRPVYRAVRRQLDRASPMELIAFPEAERIFGEAIDGVITGQLDAADALEEAQRRVEELEGDLGASP